MATMRVVLATLVASLSLSACVEHPTTGELTLAVQNGDPTDLYPAIGYLLNRTTDSGCGATLIGERTLLTAAHCLNRSLTDTEINLVRADSIRFYPVDHAGSLAGVANFKAVTLIPHPDFGGGAKSDIAVVILERAPGPEVTRIPLATQAPVLGEEVSIVGHGAVNEVVRKRIATNTVAKIYEQVMMFEGSGNICDGDSGSASLAHRNGEDVQVGVHSGRRGNCGAQGFDMRVDAYLPWITEVADGDVVIADDAGADDGETDDDGKEDAAGMGADDAEAAGCSAGAGRSGTGWLFVLAALVFVRRRK